MPRNWAWGKHRKSGYRSGLEEKVAASLENRGIQFTYETLTLSFERRVTKGKCTACGETDVVQLRTYKPDFILDNGFIIEVKGRLTAPDRTKLLAVLKCNPEIRFGLYLASDNRLQKNSEKRYSDWCRKHGIDFAIGSVPRRWLTGCKPKDSNRSEKASARRGSAFGDSRNGACFRGRS